MVQLDLLSRRKKKFDQVNYTYKFVDLLKQLELSVTAPFLKNILHILIDSINNINIANPTVKPL